MTVRYSTESRHAHDICSVFLCNTVRQTALKRQDLSRTYLAHHQLGSVLTIIIVIAHQL